MASFTPNLVETAEPSHRWRSVSKSLASCATGNLADDEAFRVEYDLCESVAATVAD